VPLARQARIAGDVQIKCTLRADGSVNNAEVLSGHPLLKEDARQNALLWRFQRSSAQVTSNTVILKYQYRLEGNPGSRTVFMVDLPDVIQIISPLPVLNP
jgi:TonB family protein